MAVSKQIEAKTRAFLDGVNSQKGPAIYQIPVEEGREAFTKMQAASPVSILPVDTVDRTIPGGPVGEIPVRVFRPQGEKRTLPVIIYTHGAGWVFGDRDIYNRLLCDITCGAHACVIYVDYTRSPEAKYPVALEQIYTVTKYVFENAKEFNIDPARFAAAGDSVGGNMTAALTMLAKERGGPKIGFQVLFYPVTDASFDNASYKEFAAEHFLTVEAMKWFWDQYLPDQASRKKPTASPLQATIEQLQGLPPAVVINAECDVLRDEGEAYAHKLIEAGVPTTAVRFHGTIHDFVMLNALAETPAALGAIALANDRLKTFFAG